MLPQATADHYRDQQKRILVATLAARQAWGLLGNRWGDNWLRQLDKVTTMLAAAQLAAARSAEPYVRAVLTETGQAATADSALNAAAFAGIASDGRSLDSLLYQPLVAAGAVMNVTQSPTRALATGRHLLDLIVQTQIADAARTATQTWMTANNVQGYVRMLNPPSCDRCIVQAGKWFKWNEGFDRHPGCDCVHIPAREADFGDFRLSPDKYFHSLPQAEQDRIFGQGNAEAIRLGADVGQVVNAKRGMTTASKLLGKGAAAAGIRATGKEQGFTLKGTTRRGIYGRMQESLDAGSIKVNVGRRGYVKNYVERRTKRARLMPESIIDLAESRDEAIRLLRLYGYLIP